MDVLSCNSFSPLDIYIKSSFPCSKACFWHHTSESVFLFASNQIKKALSELFSRKEVDEKVEGRVKYGQESVWEDHKDVAPEGRTAAAYFIQLKHLVEVKSNPGEMEEDEDDHDKEEYGGVVPVPGAALAVVDGGEHPDVEEEEERERDNAE